MSERLTEAELYLKALREVRKGLEMARKAGVIVGDVQNFRVITAPPKP